MEVWEANEMKAEAVSEWEGGREPIVTTGVLSAPVRCDFATASPFNAIGPQLYIHASDTTGRGWRLRSMVDSYETRN